LKKKVWTLIICIALSIPWMIPETIVLAANQTITSATDELNVRSGPSLNYDIITTLNKGDLYPVLKEEGEWIQIQLRNGQKGWVANYLVSAAEESTASLVDSEQAVTKEVSKTAIITVNSLNVRSEPSLNGNIVGKLQKDDTIKIISKSNDWIEITHNGQSGWISDQYIQENNSEEIVNTSNTETITSGKLTILHNGTNIRKRPNTQSTILDRANQGDTFETISFENDWYQIKLENEQIGYVASWLVATEEASRSGEAPTQISNQELGQSLKNKKIVIDPGHGGKDNGTTGYNGTLEKRITLQTAINLYHKLKEAGADVVLTRTQDRFISLPFRTNTADIQNADAFISIHYDSIKDPGVRGLSTFFYHPWQRKLAVNIHSALIDQTNMEDRGARFGDYYVIRENNRNAVLIELGFLSNPSEELLVTSNQYQDSAATGIYEGLARYFSGN
jgi:N-acetylmuramoyl-L-alanine amidase